MLHCEVVLIVLLHHRIIVVCCHMFHSVSEKECLLIIVVCHHWKPEWGKSGVSREEAESQQFPTVVHRLQKNIQGCYLELENELLQY